MKTRTLALSLLLFLPASSRVSSQAPAPARATLADFAWMTGEWRGTLKGAPPGRYAEDVVTAAAGSAIMGMFRLVEGEKTLVLEFFTLRESPEGFELRFRHFDTDLTAWEKGDLLITRLVSFDGTRAVFENHIHARPKTIEIMRTGKDSWRIRSEIIREGGENNVIELDWKRAK